MAGPWLLPIAGAVVGGGISAAKGGSFGDIAKGALLGGATGGLVGGVGSALGVGAASTAAGGAQTAAAVLSPQERLLQAAVGSGTSGAAKAASAIAPSALETTMRNVGYAQTGANLIGQLAGSKPEEPTQFLQPSPPPMVAQIPQEDLYQQLLRMSQQG